MVEGCARCVSRGLGSIAWLLAGAAALTRACANVPQYPHEAECLFAPLTGLEVQGTRIEKSTLIVEARLSVNLNALTI